MGTTPYPATPLDVSVLTAAEFGTGLHWEPPPSLDQLCAWFEQDVNRAVVWFIRDEAVRALGQTHRIRGTLNQSGRRTRESTRHSERESLPCCVVSVWGVSALKGGADHVG